MKNRNYISKDYKLRIGGNIRKWRNLRGIKQKDLALALSLSEAAISNIENNITDITLTQLEDISLGLDISIEQLLADPQNTIGLPLKYHTANEKFYQPVFERELMKAVINSIQKKDEQLQAIMQNVLHTMTTLMGKEPNMRNDDK